MLVFGAVVPLGLTTYHIPALLQKSAPTLLNTSAGASTAVLTNSLNIFVQQRQQISHSDLQRLIFQQALASTAYLTNYYYVQ